MTKRQNVVTSVAIEITIVNPIKNLYNDYMSYPVNFRKKS